MDLVETVTPFVPQAPGVPEAPALAAPGDSLLSPTGLVTRLLDRERILSTVLSSLALITVGTSAFAFAAQGSAGPWAMASSAAVASFNVLLGLMAALLPIYAAGILLGCRLPLHLLVGALLGASASGSLLLAGLAPLAYVALRQAGPWTGPLAIVGCFALSALVGGRRLHQVLRGLAARIASEGGGALTELQRHRVLRLAHNAFMILALTSALAFWAFDAFDRGLGGGL